MEQLRQIGEVLGSIKTLMVFKNEIRINQRQCSLLADVCNLAFDSITQEMNQSLNFNERHTKWKGLENPLRELHRIFKEGEQYIKQCLDAKDWWAKAISLNQNTDCIEFHIHNLLWCIPVVFEAIEASGEMSGCQQEDIRRTKFLLAKKYQTDWIEPSLFRHQFGKQYLVSGELCSQMDATWREDSWLLSQMVAEKRSSGSTKQENRLAEVLLNPRGKLLPSSILVGSKDYQVRRRLGSGSDYKEVQWMGESFVVKHAIGDIEPVVQEVPLLSSISHPNVMHIMYAFADEEKKECFLVMELMSKDLASYIREICSARRRVPFPLLVAVDILLQVARGMEYLHARKIYHGDLNPSNILVKTRTSSSDGYLHVKVSDFGLATRKNSKPSSNQATADLCICYAPEVLVEQEQSPEATGAKYTEKADVYSFAMICFELLTGKVPFEDNHLQGDKISRNIRAGERPLFPFPSPKYLTNLTKRCWQTDPLQRPSFGSICRVLRYIKRFLVMNPDHGQPDYPAPLVDYFDVEMSLLKKLATCQRKEGFQVSDVPFQMFAYRVLEREKMCINIKEKSSESGSEGTSICGDESGLSMVVSEESLSPSVSCSKFPSQVSTDAAGKKASAKKMNGKTSKQHGGAGLQAKTKPVRAAQASSCGRSLRINSESRLRTSVMTPRGERRSGHASD